MSSVSRVMHATPDQVWEVLSDGWLYPLWVVGASRMREVDDAWPEEGSKLHHSVGSWPALLDDDTEVLECQPPGKLVLRARAWPTGEAHVVLRIESHSDGSRVTIEEDVASGPGRLMPAPLRQPLLAWRNTETMRRLAFLVERRQQPAS
jgi:uncharacterized protein YndB with AHSA1/START domain